MESGTSILVASLSYSRYPVCQWAELAETVRGIISTRVLQAALPLHVLLTSGDERPWRRLQLAEPNWKNKSNVHVSVEYSSSIPRPQVVSASAKGIEVAIDPTTRLSYKTPATMDVLISIDSQQVSSWKPFLWKCGLCVAQFTVVEQSSVELVAAHLRLHAELRCCEKCSTILPNSPLAVDAPDAQQHRCCSLVVSCSPAQSPPHFPSNGLGVHARNSVVRPTNSSWKRFCQNCGLGFNSVPQYQQHLKNVHSKRRFLCPECHTSFSTKGNMTTHFQRVHNQSDSATCPICFKRISSHSNLDRHIRLVHQTLGHWPQEAATTPSEGYVVMAGGESGATDIPEGSNFGPEHGYLLCMTRPPPSTQKQEHFNDVGASLVVADVTVGPLQRRPKKSPLTVSDKNVHQENCDMSR